MPALRPWSDRPLTAEKLERAGAALARAGLTLRVAENGTEKELVEAVRAAFRERQRRAALRAKGR